MKKRLLFQISIVLAPAALMIFGVIWMQRGSQPGHSENSSQNLSQSKPENKPESAAAPSTPPDQVVQKTQETPQEQAQKSPTAPLEVAKTCYSIALRNESSTELSDVEKNFVKIGDLHHEHLNPASICVRVNGQAVSHSTAQDRIAFGPVASSKDKVTISFCTGAIRCSETCTAPKMPEQKQEKDEFMEAIRGGDDADGDSKSAQWEATDAAKVAEVNNAVQSMSDAVGSGISEEKQNGEKAGTRAPAAQTQVTTLNWTVSEETPACGIPTQKLTKLTANQ